MCKKFSYLKFEVNNEEESTKIQNLLFTCGYTWGDLYKTYLHGNRVMNTEYRFLYACTDGQIRYGYGYKKDIDIFNNCEAKLMTSNSLSTAMFYGKI